VFPPRCQVLAVVVLAAIGMSLPPSANAQYAHQQSVQIAVSANPAAPSVTLTPQRFVTISSDTGMRVRRKGLEDTSWTTLYDGAVAASYTDSTVSAGQSYEYEVRYTNSDTRFDGAIGYTAVSLGAPVVHTRGRLILVVDSTIAPAIAPELAAYEQSLIGDGWRVNRIDAPRHVAYPNTTAAPSLRSQIKALYDADPANFKGVVIIGKVQVPYSGDQNPDGHAEHLGAWPADIYYGEMNETWTDSSVTSTSATFDGGRNQNVPGDGKFDQDTINNAEMFVGRIDFSSLGDFAATGLSETDLLRRYLRKNIWYRQNQMQTARRAFVSDEFLNYTEYFSGWTGYRGIPPLYNRADVQIGTGAFATVRDALLNGNYEWSYVASAGSASGMGAKSLSSGVPVYREVKNQFYAPFGSYFGDWDQSDNGFLKSLLGAERYGLAAIWGNRSASIFTRMAVNLPLGDSLQRTAWDRARNYPDPQLYQVNYFPSDTGGVQIGIIGDPTLRLYRVNPPKAVAVDRSGPAHMVAWQPSEGTVTGYHIYRASSLNGTFTRLNTTPVAGTTYSASAGGAGDVYMVRAEAVITNPQGTFSELSQGAFSSETHANTEPWVEAQEPPFSESLVIPLTALAWDDSAAPLTVQWEKISGPGSVAFSPAGSLTPTATFSQAGYYEVRVTVSDGQFSTSHTVGVRAMGNQFVTTADAHVRTTNPTTSYNDNSPALALQDGATRTAYLKFDLGIPGARRIKKATLLLRTFTSNVQGGTIEAYAVADTSWNPDTLNANNAPAPGAQIGSFTTTNGGFGQWVSADITNHLRYASGTVSIALRSATVNHVSSDIHDAGSKAARILVEYEPTPGILSLDSSSASAFETQGQQITFTVRRTFGKEGPASVNYATQDGTALAGHDYLANSGTLTWADGDASDKTFTVTLLGDATLEANEAFSVVLSGVVGAELGAFTTSLVTVQEAGAGLILHHRFDEGSGTTINDSSPSGNNHTATGVTGATWSSEGKFGGAYGTNATTNVVAFNPANQEDMAFGTQSAYTVSAWVRTTSVGTNRDVFSKGTERRIRATTLATDGSTLNIQFSSGATNGSFSNTQNSNFRINDGTWRLLTYVNYQSGSTWKTRLYLDDGTLVQEITAGATTNTNPMTIGSAQNNFGGNRWAGLIDDFRVYNRALSQSEVAALYAGAYGGMPLPGVSVSYSGSPVSSGQQIPLGEGATSATFTVQNTGQGVLNLGSLALLPSNISCQITQAPPATLAPGASAQFTVAFTAAAPGPWNAAITLPTNVSGSTSFTVTVTGSTPGASYANWTAGIDWQGADSGANADPDGDGIANLLEYALSGNPLLGGGSILPAPGVDPESQRLTLTFARVADPALRYEVWASNDLSNWGASPIWTSTGAANTPGAVTVTDTEPPATRRFLRLKVVQQP